MTKMRVTFHMNDSGWSYITDPKRLRQKRVVQCILQNLYEENKAAHLYIAGKQEDYAIIMHVIDRNLPQKASYTTVGFLKVDKEAQVYEYTKTYKKSDVSSNLSKDGWAPCPKYLSCENIKLDKKGNVAKRKKGK